MDALAIPNIYRDSWRNLQPTLYLERAKKSDGNLDWREHNEVNYTNAVLHFMHLSAVEFTVLNDCKIA